MTDIGRLGAERQIQPDPADFVNTTENSSISTDLSKNWLKKLHIKIVQFNFAAVIWMMTVPNYILISKH